MLRTQFTPRNLANLAGWWDASVASSITLNGTTVSNWADLSGNGRDAAQATAANQPTYTAKRNNLNVVSFDGASQFVRGSWQLTLTGQTVLAVASMTNSASQYGRLFTQTTTTNGTATGTANNDYNITGHYIPLLRDVANQRFASWRTGGPRTIVNVTYGNWNVWSSLYSESTISNAIDNGTAATYNGGTYNTTFNTFGIGSFLPAGGIDGWFGGSVAEVIVYSRALSSSEMIAIHTYLKRKWATP